MIKIKTRQVVISFEYKEIIIEIQQNHFNEYVLKAKKSTKTLKMLLKADKYNPNLFILYEDFFTNTTGSDPELFFLLIEGLYFYFKEYKEHDNIKNILLITTQKDPVNNFLCLIGEYYLENVLKLKKNNHGFLLNSNEN